VATLAQAVAEMTTLAVAEKMTRFKTPLVAFAI
jgi:hypothetical protein